MRTITYFIACLMMVLSLAGCSTATKTPEEEFKGQSADQLFDSAEKALAKEDYSEAIKYFEGLQAIYPFGAHAEKAQLDIITAYYKNGDMPSAVAAADRYVNLYPRSANVDYALYMKGLADFEQDRGIIDKYLPVDLSLRDPGTMQQSYSDFNTLIQRFPDSKYAPDARQRMVYLRNLFAEHDLHVAQFYLNRKAYVAAANRAAEIIQLYQGAPQVIDALVVQVKAYRGLGLQKPAEDVMQVLRLNYPNAPQLKGLMNNKFA